jgi:hypothetical protein
MGAAATNALGHDRVTHPTHSHLKSEEDVAVVVAERALSQARLQEADDTGSPFGVSVAAALACNTA